MATRIFAETVAEVVRKGRLTDSQPNPYLAEARRRILDGETSGNGVLDVIVVRHLPFELQDEITKLVRVLGYHRGEWAAYVERGWSNTDLHLSPAPYFCHERVAIWRIHNPEIVTDDPHPYMRSAARIHKLGFWTADKSHLDARGDAANFMRGWHVSLQPQLLDVPLGDPPGELATSAMKQLELKDHKQAEIYVGNSAVFRWVEAENRHRELSRAAFAFDPKTEWISFSPDTSITVNSVTSTSAGRHH
jgi:hypothetical protein